MARGGAATAGRTAAAARQRRPAAVGPLVSVVTPVFNGAAYLAECIESVLDQTYERWEYVISDNASTDVSREIALDYARRDPRIRVEAHVEHLAHHLQSWNRAMRLISAESAYTKVVHADDRLFPDCLERMVALAESSPSVGLIGAYRLDEDTVDLDGLPEAMTVVPGCDICRSSLLGGPWPYLFGSPTSTMIRSDIVRAADSFYNEDNIHADAEACYAVLAQSDFGYVHEVLTYTRRHNESVTAFTKRVGTYVPEELAAYVRWGPVFLTAEEYERKLLVRSLNYAAFLARHASRLRDPDFRSFHRRKLGELRRQIRLGQLMRGFLAQVRRQILPGSR